MADDTYSVGSVVILEDEDGDELVAYVDGMGWSGQVYGSMGSATLENLLRANPGSWVKAVLRGGVVDSRLEKLEALEEGTIIEVLGEESTDCYTKHAGMWRHILGIGGAVPSQDLLEWADAGSRKINVLERKPL